jgi:hypothetical protein
MSVKQNTIQRLVDYFTVELTKEYTGSFTMKSSKHAGAAGAGSGHNCTFLTDSVHDKVNADVFTPDDESIYEHTKCIKFTPADAPKETVCEFMSDEATKAATPASASDALFGQISPESFDSIQHYDANNLLILDAFRHTWLVGPNNFIDSAVTPKLENLYAEYGIPYSSVNRIPLNRSHQASKFLLSAYTNFDILNYIYIEHLYKTLITENAAAAETSAAIASQNARTDSLLLDLASADTTIRDPAIVELINISSDIGHPRGEYAESQLAALCDTQLPSIFAADPLLKPGLAIELLQSILNADPPTLAIITPLIPAITYMDLFNLYTTTTDTSVKNLAGVVITRVDVNVTKSVEIAALAAIPANVNAITTMTSLAATSAAATVIFESAKKKFRTTEAIEAIKINYNIPLGDIFTSTDPRVLAVIETLRTETFSFRTNVNIMHPMQGYLHCIPFKGHIPPVPSDITASYFETHKDKILILTVNFLWQFVLIYCFYGINEISDPVTKEYYITGLVYLRKMYFTRIVNNTLRWKIGVDPADIIMTEICKELDKIFWTSKFTVIPPSTTTDTQYYIAPTDSPNEYEFWASQGFCGTQMVRYDSTLTKLKARSERQCPSMFDGIEALTADISALGIQTAVRIRIYSILKFSGDTSHIVFAKLMKCAYELIPPQGIFIPGNSPPRPAPRPDSPVPLPPLPPTLPSNPGNIRVQRKTLSVDTTRVKASEFAAPPPIPPGGSSIPLEAVNDSRLSPRTPNPMIRQATFGGSGTSSDCDRWPGEGLKLFKKTALNVIVMTSEIPMGCRLLNHGLSYKVARTFKPFLECYVPLALAPLPPLPRRNVLEYTDSIKNNAIGKFMAYKSQLELYSVFQITNANINILNGKTYLAKPWDDYIRSFYNWIHNFNLIARSVPTAYTDFFNRYKVKVINATLDDIEAREILVVLLDPTYIDFCKKYAELSAIYKIITMDILKFEDVCKRIRYILYCTHGVMFEPSEPPKGKGKSEYPGPTKTALKIKPLTSSTRRIDDELEDLLNVQDIIGLLDVYKNILLRGTLEAPPMMPVLPGNVKLRPQEDFSTTEPSAPLILTLNFPGVAPTPSTITLFDCLRLLFVDILTTIKPVVFNPCTKIQTVLGSSTRPKIVFASSPLSQAGIIDILSLILFVLVNAKPAHRSETGVKLSIFINDPPVVPTPDLYLDELLQIVFIGPGTINTPSGAVPSDEGLSTTLLPYIDIFVNAIISLCTIGSNINPALPSSLPFYENCISLFETVAITHRLKIIVSAGIGSKLVMSLTRSVNYGIDSTDICVNPLGQAATITLRGGTRHSEQISSALRILMLSVFYNKLLVKEYECVISLFENLKKQALKNGDPIRQICEILNELTTTLKQINTGEHDYHRLSINDFINHPNIKGMCNLQYIYMVIAEGYSNGLFNERTLLRGGNIKKMKSKHKSKTNASIKGGTFSEENNPTTIYRIKKSLRPKVSFLGPYVVTFERGSLFIDGNEFIIGLRSVRNVYNDLLEVLKSQDVIQKRLMVGDINISLHDLLELQNELKYQLDRELNKLFPVDNIFEYKENFWIFEKLSDSISLALEPIKSRGKDIVLKYTNDQLRDVATGLPVTGTYLYKKTGLSYIIKNKPQQEVQEIGRIYEKNPLEVKFVPVTEFIGNATLIQAALESAEPGVDLKLTELETNAEVVIKDGILTVKRDELTVNNEGIMCRDKNDVKYNIWLPDGNVNLKIATFNLDEPLYGITLKTFSKNLNDYRIEAARSESANREAANREAATPETVRVPQPVLYFFIGVTNADGQITFVRHTPFVTIYDDGGSHMQEGFKFETNYYLMDNNENYYEFSCNSQGITDIKLCKYNIRKQLVPIKTFQIDMKKSVQVFDLVRYSKMLYDKKQEDASRGAEVMDVFLLGLVDGRPLDDDKFLERQLRFDQLEHKYKDNVLEGVQGVAPWANGYYQEKITGSIFGFSHDDTNIYQGFLSGDNYTGIGAEEEYETEQGDIAVFKKGMSIEDYIEAVRKKIQNPFPQPPQLWNVRQKQLAVAQEGFRPGTYDLAYQPGEYVNTYVPGIGVVSIKPSKWRYVTDAQINIILSKRHRKLNSKWVVMKVDKKQLTEDPYFDIEPPNVGVLEYIPYNVNEIQIPYEKVTDPKTGEIISIQNSTDRLLFYNQSLIDESKKSFDYRSSEESPDSLNYRARQGKKDPNKPRDAQEIITSAFKMTNGFYYDFKSEYIYECIINTDFDKMIQDAALNYQADDKREGRLHELGIAHYRSLVSRLATVWYTATVIEYNFDLNTKEYVKTGIIYDGKSLENLYKLISEGKPYTPEMLTNNDTGDYLRYITFVCEKSSDNADFKKIKDMHFASIAKPKQFERYGVPLAAAFGSQGKIAYYLSTDSGVERGSILIQYGETPAILYIPAEYKYLEGYFLSGDSLYKFEYREGLKIYKTDWTKLSTIETYKDIVWIEIPINLFFIAEPYKTILPRHPKDDDAEKEYMANSFEEERHKNFVLRRKLDFEITVRQSTEEDLERRRKIKSDEIFKMLPADQYKYWRVIFVRNMQGSYGYSINIPEIILQKSETDEDYYLRYDTKTKTIAAYSINKKKLGINMKSAYFIDFFNQTPYLILCPAETSVDLHFTLISIIQLPFKSNSFIIEYSGDATKVDDVAKFFIERNDDRRMAASRSEARKLIRVGGSNPALPAPPVIVPPVPEETIDRYDIEEQFYKYIKKQEQLSIDETYIGGVIEDIHRDLVTGLATHKIDKASLKRSSKLVRIHENSIFNKMNEHKDKERALSRLQYDLGYGFRNPFNGTSETGVRGLDWNSYIAPPAKNVISGQISKSSLENPVIDLTTPEKGKGKGKGKGSFGGSRPDTRIVHKIKLTKKKGRRQGAKSIRRVRRTKTSKR